MRRMLLLRTLLDGGPLLFGCCTMLAAFVAFRIWVVGQMDFSAFEQFFATGLPEFIGKLLPVSFAVLATPAGRVAFGFEEFPVILLTGLWAVSRGSESLAGRLSEGTMEMLLAQPIRRITILGTHTTVTLAGCALLGAAGWLGTAAGIGVGEFENPPASEHFAPAALNLISLAICCTGLATVVSALARTRGQAVGVAVGFYVLQLTLLIVSRLTPQFEWMQWFTFLSAYDPTVLTTGLISDPGQHWPMFWKYNAVLCGLGAAGLAAAAAWFCRRDVPAPV